MDLEPQAPALDRGFPLGFVVAPAFIVGLMWLCAMLTRVGP